MAACSTETHSAHIARFDDEVCALARRICPNDGLWPPLLQRLSAAEDTSPRAIIDVLI